MKGIALVFFATGVLAVTGGMIWGIEMAIRHDHLLAPAHAHLNLVGWATMALFGIYYHTTPAAAGGLAKLHYLLALSGLVLMVPGIVMSVQGKSEVLAAIGAFLTLGSMLLFLVIVLMSARRTA